MTYLEKVKQKRELEAERKKQEQTDSKVEEVAQASKKTAAEVARQGAKSRVTTQPVSVTNDNLPSKDDLDSLIKQMKEATLASYMGGNKSSVILADSTDLGDRVEELGDKITTAIDAIKEDNSNTEAVDKLVDEFKSVVTRVTESINAQQTALSKAFDTFGKILGGIEFSPQISVAPTKVSVPKVDLSEIGEAIASLKVEEKEEFSLKCYMAQDLQTDGTFQYVGMVNPEGNWCIIENDMEAEALRFVLGDKNYKTAWKNYNNHQFMLYDEAVNAVSA